MVDSPSEQNCPIELQIESGNTIVDTICNEPTEHGHAGLCEKHYQEYLIVTITKANLETTSILTAQNYHELLRFQGVTIPSKLSDQKDIEYRRVCEQVTNNIDKFTRVFNWRNLWFQIVKNNIPLQWVCLACLPLNVLCISTIHLNELKKRNDLKISYFPYLIYK